MEQKHSQVSFSDLGRVKCSGSVVFFDVLAANHPGVLL